MLAALLLPLSARVEKVPLELIEVEVAAVVDTSGSVGPNGRGQPQCVRGAPRAAIWHH